ncbi:MAG: XRE family transcriptional regulator [Cyclobacteriaceae bacterium]
MTRDAFHIKTNPAVLKWARESLSLNKTKAAKVLDFPSSRLEQLETGAKFPSLSELKMMSKVYKRTIATLLLVNPPVEKPLPKDCRTVNSSQLGKFHEKTILAVRKARALANSLLELRNEMNVRTPPFRIRATMHEDPLKIAIQVRQLLALHEFRNITHFGQALEAYIERLETFGIAVFQISLTQDKLRGFSITDDILPIIVVKKGGELISTKIFTLFHELGHIILNIGGLCDITLSVDAPKIEKWCNSFAAELLVPSTELLANAIVRNKDKHDPYWQKKDLEEIGKDFHVGPLVILRRLLAHHLTTSKVYGEKHITWNKPAFGRKEHPEGRNIAREIITEKGRGYVSLAFKAFDQNKINIKDLSDFLGVGFSYLPKTRQLLIAE